MAKLIDPMTILDFANLAGVIVIMRTRLTRIDTNDQSLKSKTAL